MWWTTTLPVPQRPDYDADVVDLVKLRRPMPAGFEPRCLRCLTCDSTWDLYRASWADTYLWLDAHESCAVGAER